MLAARPTKSGKGRGRPPGGPVRPSKPKSIIAALGDPDLFGGMFDAPSWEPWRAFLAALQALPMTAEQLDRYGKHTGRCEPPTRPARYAELVVGRRGGKIASLGADRQPISHASSIIATTSCQARRRLSPIIARDRTQAKVILNYIRAFCARSRYSPS